MVKKLYRSRTDKMLGGVSGGIADYFSIDPTIVRIIWIILFLIPPHFFIEVLIYIVLWIIVPLEPKRKPVKSTRL